MAPVLACTDGSTYAPSIYDHAAWCATRLGAAVRILHALEHLPLPPARDLSGSIGFDANAELLEELTRLGEAHGRVARLKGQAILDDAVRHLLAAGVTDVSGIQRHGSVVETLDEFEPSSSLVVVGKRGEHADFARGHLGSNLERVIRSASIPVLVAARTFTSIERFVIAFDGGPSSLKAIHFAAQQPLLRGLECHLITAGKPGSDLAREQEAAATALTGAGFTVHAEVVSGNPEEVIAEQVHQRQAQLLVMGAYGHSRIRQLVIGSTTTSLIRTCLVPVLLFR
jgi:nucleotide-binding universal stress UspA family protein